MTGILIAIGIFLLLAFKRASLSVFAIAFAVLLLFYHPVVSIVLWIIVFIPLLTKSFRQKILSCFALKLFRRAMPTMSDTEREALTAGNVGWEGELFSGMPNWSRLAAISQNKLSAEEQEFLSGPVEQLCCMINNWKINFQERYVSNEIIDFCRQQGFFGLIIPKQYGGKQFSAFAHSQIIIKIASVNTAVATVVSVPNSLGPAELLWHYGTEAQKNHYLPRLAKGEEIPCFALTSPLAGSDAAAIEDHGVICESEYQGQKQLCIRLNWSKRYITLSPIATLLGLAFKLYDPDHLLGNAEELGITCALIPVSTPGVITGRRHYPMLSPFPNGPTQGNDVLIPIDDIIGGRAMAGKGWKMLMECLAAGRSISLPSMALGNAKKALFVTGYYARLRRQFHTYIGAFEGIKAVLARMLGHGLMMEATRLLTVRSIDQGDHPAVASAIAKSFVTELGRSVITDAMDVHGGKAICMGPNNVLAQAYVESPISITVEGANILTRFMIIFGQGAIRCHPFVLKEIKSAEENNLIAFDQALWGHAGFMLSNSVRSVLLGLTSGYLASAPKSKLKRYYQHFSRFSSALAFTSDMAMLTLGGSLKRKEHLSARLGDIFSRLYIGSAVLRWYSFHPSEFSEKIVAWACEDLLFDIQQSFLEFFQNYPYRWLAVMIKRIVFPLGANFSRPRDRLTNEVAGLLLQPNPVLTELTEPLFLTPTEHHPFADWESLVRQTIELEPLLHQLHKLKRDHLIHGKTFAEEVDSALQAKHITAAEAAQLHENAIARLAAMQVDDFGAGEL